MNKKIFYFAAAAALTLTACTSEEDFVQTEQKKQVAQQEVSFDVYTPAASDVNTRAGFSEGVMNTSRLQKATVGFGLYGYYTDQTNASAVNYTAGTSLPNFMVNQKVAWNNTNKGWEYSPLKYWPNETQHDSQTNPDAAVMDGTNSLLDQLTFFAYAPYVASGSGTEGITAITANTGKLTTTGTVAGERAVADPAVEYMVSASPKDAVDLLWGVAPAGGLEYTAVNGTTDGANEGLPYIDLAKPDVNTSLKFYFQHALARFGFTIAAAIDQLPQGGSLDANTKISVEQVDLTGYFGTEGILNLNNSVANVANWFNLAGTDLAAGTALDAGALAKRTVTLTGADLNATIKDQGAQIQTIEGVTTAKKDVAAVRYYQVDKPTSFVAGDKYYTNAGVEKFANLPAGTYYYEKDNSYYKTTNSAQYPTTYYDIAPSSKLAADPAASANIYKKVGDNYIFEVAFTLGTPTTLNYSGSDEYYTLTATAKDPAVTASNFTWPDGDYYKPERSFLMVIPTNNVPNICTTNFTGVGNAANVEALQTVWVKITYYVTTADANLNGGYSRVKNVVEKKVVLPSLENGKSYNLNLLLGLTSVKVEAEVGDWQEVYIQTDLPQNTPGE